MKIPHLAISIFLCSIAPLAAATNPVEVGHVAWSRDFDAALAKSAETKKPVFVLFQEVPGCAGCQRFGAEVLTHPQLVEAIETEFVPVLIHNNKPGEDAVILKRYGEPAWNFQVIRFLDAKGKDIIPRKDQVWTINGVASRMIAALDKAKRPVPGYLRAVAAESKAPTELRTAGFAMSCFWTGEMKLGAIDGVVQTEAGWLEGREVTLVRYDPGVISFANLAKKAEKSDCADKTYSQTEGYRAASKSDQKKQLQGTPFANLQLSPIQATKVNAWARIDPKKALEWLSPSQREELK